MRYFGVTETRAGEPKFSRVSSQKTKTIVEKSNTSGKSGASKVSHFLPLFLIVQVFLFDSSYVLLQQRIAVWDFFAVFMEPILVKQL